MENNLPGILFSNMPIINFIPFYNLQQKNSNNYEIPIYKTILRTGSVSTTGSSTNFITSL